MATEDEKKKRLKEVTINGNFLLVRQYVWRGVSRSALDEALIEAIKNGHFKIVKYLHQNGANIHIKGPTGNTLIMLAAVLDFLDIVKSLVFKGANINARDNEGNDALLCAAKSEFIDVFKYLGEQGANPNVYNKEGKTAGMYFATWKAWKNT